MMAITALYAAPLAMLFLWLSVRVITRRSKALVPFGPGEDRDLLQRMRIHANFAEYTPLALILMALAESLSAPHILLHLTGLLLLAGRFIHGVGLSQNPNKIKLRVVGMLLTFAAIALAALVAFCLAILNAFI